MRDIKYRAYHKELKEMFYFDLWVPWEAEDKNGNIWYTKHMEFMQFTGLTDKNGVEIYEKDIYKNSWNTYSVVEIVSNDGWQTTGYNTGDREIFIGFKMKAVPKEIEIVGNIPENPELLNV